MVDTTRMSSNMNSPQSHMMIEMDENENNKTVSKLSHSSLSKNVKKHNKSRNMKHTRYRTARPMSANK